MIIPTGFAQVNWKFTGDAVPLGAEVTMGLDLIGSPTPTDVATVMGSAWEDNLINYQVGTCELASVLVKFGPNATGPSADVVSGANGGASGVGLEPQVAVIVKKITADGGHAGKGRFYIPGFPDAAFTEGGLMDGPTLTALQADVDQFLADLDSVVGTPVLLHGADSPIATPSPITALVVDNRCGTQRRRNRR